MARATRHRDASTGTKFSARTAAYKYAGALHVYNSTNAGIGRSKFRSNSSRLWSSVPHVATAVRVAKFSYMY